MVQMWPEVVEKRGKSAPVVQFGGTLCDPKMDVTGVMTLDCCVQMEQTGVKVFGRFLSHE